MPLSNWPYCARTCSQYAESLRTLSASRPVSRSVPLKAFSREPMLGWEVMPLMLSQAQSTTSAPASAAAIMLATPMPGVSWVCTWMGMSGNSLLSAETSIFADAGLSRPAMSLIPRMWTPASTSSLARSR